MEFMENKNLIVSLVVIVVIIIIASLVSRNNNVENPTERDNANIEETEKETLNVKHQYKDGEHVFVGTLQLPTPCHSYNAEVVETENGPEIKITITEPAQDQVCAQVISEKDFKVTYKSDNPDLEFKYFVNGTEVNFNLFEVSPEENIDTFELFIKG
jgi:hypothetical protein